MNLQSDLARLCDGSHNSSGASQRKDAFTKSYLMNVFPNGLPEVDIYRLPELASLLNIRVAYIKLVSCVSDCYQQSIHSETSHPSELSRILHALLVAAKDPEDHFCTPISRRWLVKSWWHAQQLVEWDTIGNVPAGVHCIDIRSFTYPAVKTECASSL